MSENRKKRKSIWLKRPLALLLALVMMITSVDMSVFATAATEITQAETSTEQEIETQVEESEEEVAEVSTEEESEEEAAEVSTEEESEEETAEVPTEEESEEETAEIPTEEESEEETAEVSTEEESKEETDEALTEEETAPTEEGEEETAPTEGENTTITENVKVKKSAKSLLSSAEPISEGPVEINVASYSETIFIYSSLKYSQVGGEKGTSNGQGYILTGETNQKIALGNQTSEDLKGNISVTLKDLKTPEMEILSISGDGTSYAVEVSVDSASTITTLQVKDNAELELTLNADLTVDTLELRAGSKLTINTNGHKLKVNNLSVIRDAESEVATVEISGSGTVEATAITVDNLSVGGNKLNITEELSVTGNLSLDGTTLNVGKNVTADGSISIKSANVTLAGGKLTSGKEISIKDSVISKVSLLGFETSVEGEKSLTLEHTELSEVTIAGAAEDSKAIVTVTVDATSNVGDTAIVQDYAITYEAAGQPLTAGADWPVHYRVINGVVSGYHTASGYSVAVEGKVTLPTYSQDGYAYKGWTLNDQAITELTGKLSGDIILVAELEAGDVVITMDLGFEPTEYTHDDHENVEQKWIIKSEVAGTVDMKTQVPTRFGYIFAGWKTDKGTEISKDAENYTVTFGDLTLAEGETNAYTMSMTAQWTKDTFPLRLYVGKTIAAENLQVSFDSGKTLVNIADVSTIWPEVTYDAGQNRLAFTKRITYEQTLGEYFEENSMSFPILFDASLTKKFDGWKLLGSSLDVTEETEYSLESGLLIKDSEMTLNAYQTALREQNTITFEPVWGEMEYTLTTDIVNGWKILVDGTEVTPENGEIVIRTGKKVTYQCSKDSKTGISLWEFVKTLGSEHFSPTERTFEVGDQVLSYDFVMPASDVVATYQNVNNIWINLHTSPITFEENVVYNNVVDSNGKGRTGFWYNEIIDEMSYLFHDNTKGYFYQWDMANTIQVTSKGLPTQNQLTLVNATTVCFKDCDMVAREAYTRDLVDLKMDGTRIENNVTNAIQDKTLSDYANVVLNTETNKKYKTKLYFEETNTLGAVFPTTYSSSTDYNGQIEIYGRNNNPELYLGLIFGNYKITFSGLKVKQYNKSEYQSQFPDHSKFMIYVHGVYGGLTDIIFKGCDVEAEDKKLFTAFYGLYCQNYNGIGTNASLGYVKSEDFILNGQSSVHIMEDLYTGYRTGGGTFRIKDTSSLVVDGSIYSNYQSGATREIDTSGHVIVKGNHFSADGLNLKNGTVIANATMIGTWCSISGGTLITNLMINQVWRPSLWDFDAEGNYVVKNNFPNAGDANLNGDDAFILTTPWVTSSGGYAFSGGEIYLLGYYEENVGSKRYNLNFTSETVGNPIKEAIEATLKGEDVDGKALVEKSKSTAKECFVLGFSTGVKTATSGRSFGFTGSKVYAAGNMTLFNDTTISGGIVECAGKLSSKRDLVITGGTVNAEEIGNSYNLTYTLTDKCLRWQETRISGGTVKTNRLGTLSTKINGVEPRSTVVLENVAIEPLDKASEIQVVHDVYVNYIYDSTYTVPDNPKNPENVRYTATLNDEKSLSEISDMTLTDDSLNAVERLAFVAPTANDGETAVWRLDALNGKIINAALNQGALEGENQSVIKDDVSGLNLKGYDRETFRLYAAKDRYALIIKEGLDEIKEGKITIDGTSTEIIGDSVKVPFDSQVKIPLKDLSMSDKVVVWYYDGKGLLHNAIPNVVNGEIVFSMPAAATEVFITDNLSLYLNEHDILFTPYGFSKDLEATNLDVASDTVFLYRGNLIVTQSNIDLTGAYPDYTTGGVKGEGAPDSVYYGVDKKTGKPVGIGASNTAKYQMIFASGSGNANEGEDALNRDITLIDLNQCNRSALWGLKIPENEKIVFKISGPVQLMSVIKERNSSLSFIGMSERKELAEDVCGDDYLRLCPYGANHGLEGYGDTFFENLTLVRFNNETLVKLKDASTLKFDHCYLNTCNSDTYYGETAGDLIINDCYMILGREISSRQYSKSFLVKDSVIKSIGSSDRANFLQEMNYLELDNSSLDISYVRGSSVYAACNTGAKNIVLKNGSTITADGRLNVNALELHDTSSVVVTGEPESFLLCPNIVLYDESTVSADYILLSGYYQDMDGCGTVEEITKKLQAGTSVLNGNSKHFRTGVVPVGLVLNGGTVTAKEFVGGDVNGKITVNAGTLEAKKIGTFGATFGHARYIPKTGEEWVYRYDRIPTAASVTVNGGTVNVTENGYLGGMKSTVSINGGTVNLADNALIGLTDADYDKLVLDAIKNDEELATPCTVTIGDNSDSTKATVAGTGSINVPSGNVTIQGTDTGIQVVDLKALEGTITIAGANAQYDNPYVGVRKHDEVGVLVSGLLKAQDVTIQNGAVVYANKAYAEATAGENGSLRITAGEEGNLPAYLYIGEGYGSSGAGNVDIYVDNNNEDADNYSHVYGATIRKITYHLMDDSVDPATNHPDNREDFVFGEGTIITLGPPERYGYNFLGWYDNDAFTGEPLVSVTTNANRDYDLYARWEPKTVEFTVIVEGDVVDLSLEEMQAETAELVEAGKGSYDAATNTFTFKKVSTAAYLHNIVDKGEGYVDLDNYRLKSYSIPALAIQDPEFRHGEKVAIVSASTKVSSELLDVYTAKGAPIILKVQDKMKDSVAVTLDLNLDSVSKRPINSKFNNVTESQYPTDTTMVSYVEFGNPIIFAQGFKDDNGELITASAPGYTFNGWKAKDGTEYIDKDFVITQESAKTFYADWTPNEYLVTFDATAGAVVTTDGLEPEDSDIEVTVSGKVTYDTLVNGGIDYSDSQKDQLLPKAWKKGYVFVGWSYDGGTSFINADTELNLTDIPNLDVTKDGENTALTLTAIYRPVKVVYNLNGGKWIGEAPTSTPDYEAALAGYTKNGSDYAIVDTPANEFAATGAHATSDYRHTLMRKGYTFKGWKDDNGNEISKTPDYADVTLTAQWSANTYKLQLNATNDTLRPKRVYGHNDVGNPEVTVTVGEELKDNLDAWPSRDSDDINNDWWVKNLDDAEASERYILGFTFDALDPGDTREGNAGYQIYKDYSGYVNILTNNKTLFIKKEGTSQAGSTFFLPEASQYNELVTGTTEVPDYPNGSIIPMYAVYREVSLVFVHYVQKDDGSIEEIVMHTAPWNTQDEYPINGYPTEDEYRQTVAANYKPVGWFIHGPSTTARPYATYDDKDGWQLTDYYADELNRIASKTYAKGLGTYDIKVYTVYAKQTTVYQEAKLSAGSNPKVNESAVYEYPIPGSMQPGELNYTITHNTSNLNFVTYDEFVANNGLFDSLKADDTVAIKVELVKPDGTVEGTGKYLLDTQKDDSKIDGTIDKGVAKDWKIRLTLYYSSVMTTEEDFQFKVKFGFENAGLEHQWLLFENFVVDLTPSIWEVTYQAKLPGIAENLIITDWNNFEQDDDTKEYIFVDDVSYGSNALTEAEIPVIEGYASKDQKWTVENSSVTGGESIDYGNALNVAVTAANQGKIKLSTEWKIQSYELTADEKVLADWTITYGGTELTSTGAEVPYRTEIKFVPKNRDAAAGTPYPEFVWLEMKDGQRVRLDLLKDATYNDTDGSYTFLMPASDVHVVHDDVMELYLRNDHIEIYEDGFIQDYPFGEDQKITWRGNYAILMDKDQNAATPTDHTLTIDGNLAGRTIALDDLYIDEVAGAGDGNKSINLIPGTTATLTTSYDGKASTIKAKNILVPGTATLTMNGDGTLIMTPDANYAAIGGDGTTAASGACGTISLNGLTIDMTLPGGSVASGIGAGNQVEGGTNVTISKCAITVTEQASSGKVYSGTWFGGAKVGNVVLEDTAVYRGENSAEIVGTQVTNGVAVTLTATTIGTSANPVTAPINAQQTLTIQADSTGKVSNIYQNLTSKDAVAIGTSADGGVTVVKGGSTIDAEILQPKVSDAGHKVLYTGALHIMDAKSDVVIANTQVVETRNGNVTISETDVTQDGKTLAHSGNYRLINEREENNIDLTVDGLNGNSVIETTRLKLNTVNINADATIELLADLEFVATGSLNIAEGKTLTVEENSVPNTYTMNLNGITSDKDAAYKQKGGVLATNNPAGFEFNELDMILEDVTVTQPNLIAENLTLIDSTVTATGGKVGSKCAGDEKVTNVIIQGASKVTADTIGALGAQDETFTFVTVGDTATITGKLVRDLYRLNYNLDDSNFKKADGVLLTKEGGAEVKLHTVLRETTTMGGTATVDPTIPGDPIYKGGGTNYFENWYILQEEEMHALSDSAVDGFAGFTALSEDKLQYADPVATDGTQTLQIWARLKIRGTGAIVEERQLNDVLGATETTVTVPTDGAWTAIFTAEGAKIDGGKYQAAFSEALPQGTKLTLIDRSNSRHPVFYSYKVTTDDVTAIAFDSFVRMGKADEKAELPADVAGAELKTRILLAADFSDTNVSAGNTEYDVTFQLKVGETTPIDIAKVSYKLSAAPVATLVAAATKVTAAWSGDERLTGQKLYLVGELGDTVSVPYNATAKVGGNEARWLSGNKVVLEVGNAEDKLTEREYTYELSNLAEGDYTITWKLTASKDDYNVLGNELATDTVEITAAKPADSPSMKVVIKTIDGKPETSRVLAAGTAHTVVFDVETNSGKDLVDITVTKQGVLGEFREEAKTVLSNGNLPEPLAYFAENTPAGTYRVCFSIPGIDGTADDVYFTFIVE